MSNDSFPHKAFSAECPHCNWLPLNAIKRACKKCNRHFDPFIHYGICPRCLTENSITCDIELNGCGRTTPISEWYINLPGMVDTLKMELENTPLKEYQARKLIEEKISYEKYCLYTEIAFEDDLHDGGDTDCREAFSSFTTLQLIEHFNTQAGRDELSKTDCRRMFILLRELVKRKLDFNFFKSFNKIKNRHYFIMSDPIELWGNKVMLTYPGRMKYI